MRSAPARSCWSTSRERAPTAKFTFRGQKNSTVPDMPPLETVDAEGTPVVGPDDTEGPTDVPKSRGLTVRDVTQITPGAPSAPG